MSEVSLGVRRPDKRLLWVYLVRSLAAFVAQPFVFLYLYFRYHTLRYEFDARGVRQSYGILFHREVFLTYGRIQDIHVTRGIVERWLGLGTVELQTASGSSGAQVEIEGLPDYEAVRDFLYGKMRGLKSGEVEETPVAKLLADIRDELKGARQALEAGRERV